MFLKVVIIVKLKIIAEALGVCVEENKNYSDEGVINYFNIFNEAVSSINFGHNDACTLNTLDKVVEFYERLVQVEKEKVEYLEKLFKVK